MKNTNRKQHELTYQAERALQIGNIQPTEKKAIQRYRKVRWWRFFPKEYVFKVLGDINGKLICDLGCGEGVIASQSAILGAEVTAIDISPKLIEIAERRAILDGVKDKIEFIVADAEELNIPENRFDFLVTYEVLHHIDIPKVMQKMILSLKAGGKAIIVEPIACSSLIQKIRNIAPVEVDGGHHDPQLNIKDLQIISGYFDNYQMTFFRLFGRLERLFPRGSYINNIAMLILNIFDRLILNLFPFLWKFCGIVVIVGVKENIRKE